eukprot:10007188-Ditylum_brightwellii.AAC.1
MDTVYILVRDLLRFNALMAFNNKQATIEEQTADNLEQCLNVVTVHFFLNKAYKLQEQYIWHMVHKPRHISAHEWIARVIKLNNYLMEFPISPVVKPRKMDWENILKVLEKNPTSWKFQMDKEGFDASFSTIKDLTKICVCYKEYKPVIPEMLFAACKSPSEREGKCNQSTRQKKVTTTGDKLLSNVTQMTVDVILQVPCCVLAPLPGPHNPAP